MNSTDVPRKTFDVIVVGNGVLGLSLGLELSRRGQDVAVLGEPHRPYAGSTAAVDDVNFNIIRDELARYDTPYEDVDPLDLDWVDAEPISRPLRAFHIPGEHAVSAPALLTRLQDAFVAEGGTIVPAEAEHVDY